VTNGVHESFVPTVASREDWWQWVDVNLLWQPPQGNYSASGVLPCSQPTQFASLTGLVGDDHATPLLQPEDAAVAVPGSLCTDQVSRLLGENLVVGGIRFRVVTRELQGCAHPSIVVNGPAQCLATDAAADRQADDNTMTWDVSSGNVASRRATLQPHREGGPGVTWITRLTRRVDIDMTLFNPNLAILVALRLTTEFSSKVRCVE